MRKTLIFLLSMPFLDILIQLVVAGIESISKYPIYPIFIQFILHIKK